MFRYQNRPCCHLYFSVPQQGRPQLDICCEPYTSLQLILSTIYGKLTPIVKVSTSLHKDAVWVTKIYVTASLWRSEEPSVRSPERESEANRIRKMSGVISLRAGDREGTVKQWNRYKIRLEKDGPKRVYNLNFISLLSLKWNRGLLGFMIPSFIVWWERREGLSAGTGHDGANRRRNDSIQWRWDSLCCCSCLGAIQPAALPTQGEGHCAYLSSTLFLINYSSATFPLQLGTQGDRQCHHYQKGDRTTDTLLDTPALTTAFPKTTTHKQHLKTQKPGSLSTFPDRAQFHKVNTSNALQYPWL